MSNSATRAKQKYNDKNYDKTIVMSKKGIKDNWKAEAEKEGLSLNAFIIQAINYYIETKSTP